MTRFNNPQPEGEQNSARVIDKSKRYDVYCVEHGLRVIVYKDVKIIGTKLLLEGESFADITNKFLEIEQADGSRVFISKHGRLRFCEHGTEVSIQEVAG